MNSFINKIVIMTKSILDVFFFKLIKNRITITPERVQLLAIDI